MSAKGKTAGTKLAVKMIMVNCESLIVKNVADPSATFFVFLLFLRKQFSGLFTS